MSRQADLEAQMAREKEEKRKRNAAARKAEKERLAKLAKAEENALAASPPRELRKISAGEGKPLVLPPPGIFARNINTIGGRGNGPAGLMRYWYDRY